MKSFEAIVLTQPKKISANSLIKEKDGQKKVYFIQIKTQFF